MGRWLAVQKGRLDLAAIEEGHPGPLPDVDDATEYLRRTLAYLRERDITPWDDRFGKWCAEDDEVLDLMLGVSDSITKYPGQPRDEAGRFAEDAARPNPQDYHEGGEGDAGGLYRAVRDEAGGPHEVSERYLYHDEQWSRTRPGRSQPVLVDGKTWTRRVVVAQVDHGPQASTRYTASYEYRDRDGNIVNVAGRKLRVYDKVDADLHESRGGQPKRPPSWADGPWAKAAGALFVEKHYPGQHDQSTHGDREGGGEDVKRGRPVDWSGIRSGDTKKLGGMTVSFGVQGGSAERKAANVGAILQAALGDDMTLSDLRALAQGSGLKSGELKVTLEYAGDGEASHGFRVPGVKGAWAINLQIGDSWATTKRFTQATLMPHAFMDEGKPELRLLLRSFYLPKSEQGHGTGTTAFVDCVAVAERIGVKAMLIDVADGPRNEYEAEAAMSEKRATGYYIWPLLGFDSKVYFRKEDYGEENDLTRHFSKYKRMSEIMSDPKARAAWRRYGQRLEGLKFDMKRGSTSRKLLDRYMAERKRKGKAAKASGIELWLDADEIAALEAAWDALAEDGEKRIGALFVEKHLPGQHDQADHGNWAGAADAEPEKLVPSLAPPTGGESVEEARAGLSKLGLMRDSQGKPTKVTSAQLEANIEAYLKNATAAQEARGREWYGKAREFAESLPAKFPNLGLTNEQAIAAVAACAANAGWDDDYGTSDEAGNSNQVIALKVLGALNENPEITITQEQADAYVESRAKALGGNTAITEPPVGKVRLRDLSPEMAVAFYRFGGMPVHVVPIMRMLRGDTVNEALGGTKIRSFYKNIAMSGRPGSDDAVTYDLWMARVAFNNRDIDGDQYSQLTKTHTKYKLVADALRAVAAKHGLTPRDLQAIAWVSYREKQLKRSDSKAEAKRLFESTMKEAARLAKQLARQSWTMEQALYDPEKAAPKRASRAPEDAEDPQVLARLMWIAWKTSGQYAEFFGGDGEKAAPQLVFDFVTVVERVIKEFDEGQPRDERGRWASAGGGAPLRDSRSAAGDSRRRAPREELEELHPSQVEPTIVVEGVPLHFGEADVLGPDMSAGPWATKAHIIDAAESAVKAASAAGLPLPKGVVVTTKMDWAGGNMARYQPKTRTVQVCDGYVTNDGVHSRTTGTIGDLVEVGEKLSREGFLSQPNVVLHELAHAAHFQSKGGRASLIAMGVNPDTGDYNATNPDARFTGLEERVAASVSGYARKSKVEFVAETLAGMLAGKTYDEQVMRLYRDCGGPEVKR